MNINVRPFQKQAGGIDCGLFAIAAVTALALNINPSVLKLKQEDTWKEHTWEEHTWFYTMFPAP